MKNLLAGILFLFSAIAFSQESSFNKKWATIDSLEISGKTSSANNLVQDLVDEAFKEKDYLNYIKGKIYHYKFHQLIEEKSNNYILNDINNSLKKLPVAYSNILNSYKAEILKDYFSANQYKIRNRSTISDPDPEDLETWSSETFLDSIKISFNKSISEPEVLVNISTEDLAILLKENEASRQFQPTALDILSGRAIDFYSNSSFFTNEFGNEKFDFLNEKLLDNSAEFLSVSIPDSISANVTALKIYQQMEQQHLQENHSAALIYWTIQRLKFTQDHSGNEEKGKLSLATMQGLLDKASGVEAETYLKYQIAYQLYEMANDAEKQNQNKEDNEKKDNNDYLVEDVNLLNDLIDEYPETKSTLNARILKSMITKPVLNSKVPGFLAENEPGRIYLSFKNLDTLYQKVIKVPGKFERSLDYRTKDSIIHSFAKEYKDSSMIVLPGEQDYSQHSTEVLLEGRATGNYLVYLYNQDYHNYGFYQVTNLSVSETVFKEKTMFQVKDRTSGAPVSSAKVISATDKSYTGLGQTDQNGEFSHRNSSSYNYRKWNVFAKKGDTIDPFYVQNSYRNRDQKVRLTARVLFFLDRGIYRPGQTVHFKGVLLKHENDSTNTVPNEMVSVQVNDPNGEEVESFQFETNDFGSFTGSITLPKSGITGEFTIFSKYEKTRSSFWNKIRKSDFYGSYSKFSVEEYKRPTFEVAFDTVRDGYKLNDTAVITGNVRSFMGAAIANATIAYEVKRERLISYWWYEYYSDEVIIETDSVTADENGNFKIEFKTKAPKNSLDDPGLIYRYTITASATDITGESRSGKLQLRLGNKNLLAEIDMQENLSHGDTLRMAVRTTNLNDNLVPVNGKLTVYKLKAPGKIMNDRLWEAPEFNNISEEEFNELFPYEPYKDAMQPVEWPKAELYYTTYFESDGDFEDFLKVRKDWDEGNYIVEVKVETESNSTEAKKVFKVTNPDRKYLADNEKLAMMVENENPAKDAAVQLKIQTAYQDLFITLMVFDDNKMIFQKLLQIDGTENLTIPLENIRNTEVKILASGVKNSASIEKELKVNLQKEEETLNFTTRTFRDKLQPGLEETWSFSLDSNQERIPETEILASMYDKSLDQFKTSNWNTNPNFRNRYSQYPEHQNSSMGRVVNLNNNFPSIWRYRSRPFIFDNLSLFGFDFGSPNSYMYKRYIQHKKIQMKDPARNGITGLVVDEDGLELPGINVQIKGTTQGTTTDFNGEFSLAVKPGDILVFSFVGFKTEEYIVKKDQKVYAVLSADAASLDEVVTVGYGVQQKRNIVGAEIVEVEEYIGDANFMQIEGKVPGVQVEEDSEENLVIRGTASIGNENALYIVDGKVVKEYDLSTKDILTIEVLKPAEASALYGSRGANGAVIITTKRGLNNLGNVEARTNLEETAFFFPDLKLTEEGKLEFSFTTPEALTSWNFRMLAHTKNWTTGKFEKIVKTQKDLNVIPNPPRFLREGDSIVFKAKISNLSTETLTGTAVLQLYNAVTMQPIDGIMNNSENLKNFRMKASNSDMVSWKLYVPDTIPAVTYRILAKAGNFSDGEENILPILKNRMLVKESIPLFVRSDETETFHFETLENADSKTLQNHQFSIEYSANPAWYAIQSLPYLMEYEHECSEQIFSRIFANSLGNKIVTSQPKIAEVFQEWEKDSTLNSNLEKNEDLKTLLLAETPWVMDAESESAEKNRMAKLFEESKLRRSLKNDMNKLESMQLSSGSFPWFSGGFPSYYITRHIVSGFGNLEELGVDLKSDNLLKKAIHYLDSEFLKVYKQSKNDKNEKYFLSGNFALYYVEARVNHLDKFPFPSELKPIVANVVQNHKENWLQHSLYEKAILSLVLEKWKDHDAAVQILESLKETAVNSDAYGMYWKENEPSWFFSRTSTEVQAKIIEAFSKITNDQKTIEELKIWLIQNKRSSHWKTTKATTAASYALIMQGEDWLNTATNTKIKIAGKSIDSSRMAKTRKEAGTGYIRLNWDAEEVNKYLGTIEIENNNSSPGYGGAYWQYFEDLDKIEVHSESPLNIEKEIYLKKAGNQLQQITPESQLQVGDLVSFRLVIRAEADMDFIHVKDMRASGFEPTDVLSQYKSQDGTYYYQSTRDAATHFFFDSLREGTYVLEYTVRANNAGKFSNGITTIESMYAPEFSGHTKGIRVTIDDEKQ